MFLIARHEDLAVDRIVVVRGENKGRFERMVREVSRGQDIKFEDILSAARAVTLKSEEVMGGKQGQEKSPWTSHKENANLEL